MELRHLRYFVTLAEEGHFGRAAERLHIVQPTLSMQIRDLERELGGPLFVRTSRSVELTEAGEVLLVEARRTLAQAAHAQVSVERSLRGETGSVRVGFAGVAVLIGKLTDDLRAFHVQHPDAVLELHEMAPSDQGSAILSGELDVGYSPSYGFVFDPELVIDRIGDWPLVVALAADHPLARLQSISLEALADEPLIVYASGETDDSTLTALRRRTGSEPHVAHRVSSTLSVLALAAAGLGLALVPQPTTQVSIPNITYRPMREEPMAADLVLVSRPNDTSGAVRAFLALARG